MPRTGKRKQADEEQKGQKEEEKAEEEKEPKRQKEDNLSYVLTSFMIREQRRLTEQAAALDKTCAVEVLIGCDTEVAHLRLYLRKSGDTVFGVNFTWTRTQSDAELLDIMHHEVCKFSDMIEVRYDRFLVDRDHSALADKWRILRETSLKPLDGKK